VPGLLFVVCSRSLILASSRIHCVFLVIGYTRSRAINYECAYELYLSQHDVMRELALHLASRDWIVHRKRLFMPKTEHGLSGKWELLKDQAFDA